MSTNSRLRAVYPTEKGTMRLKPIYCHWDGYPSNMLPLLNENYNTIEKVEELMALGNLSYLAERVKPEPEEEHSFDKPIRDITVAYHRDRGEDLEFWNDRQHYNYIFNGETWKIE